MRFLMFVCRDGSIAFTPEQRANIGPEVEAWVAEMERRGVREQGGVLAPVGDAVTLCVRDGEVIVAPGARDPVGEPISGFNLLECNDIDEALEVSAQHPIARFGRIELRPIAAW